MRYVGPGLLMLATGLFGLASLTHALNHAWAPAGGCAAGASVTAFLTVWALGSAR